MVEPLSPETLAWLRQAAAAGAAEPRVLLHLMERLEALENDCIEQSQSSRFCNNAIVRRLEALEGAAAQPANPAHAATEMVPTPESAPAATDDELFDLFHQHGPLGIVLRGIYNLGRQHGAARPSDTLPARVLTMCKKRGWSLHWSSRGAYLHLEVSELIEALRGKRGKVVDEAADVLLVLMSITENAGIPWGEVLDQVAATCARLEVCDTHPGEEQEANPEGAPPVIQRLIKAPMDAKGYVDLRDPPVAKPAPPAAPPGLVERLQLAVRMSGGSLMDDEWQAVVCQVAEWLDLEGYNRAANDLREEIAK
jgi:NTP pyrophosphatase (non-canonical NTP hydrolase)